LAGVAGALMMLVFAFSSLLIINGFSLDQIALPSNALLSLIIMLMSPIAGGFLAGLIAQEKPRQAGLIAGLIAGLVVLIAWLVMVGYLWETLLSGLVVMFVWIFLSRLGSGFSTSRQSKS
jgi:Na+/proline symporter